MDLYNVRYRYQADAEFRMLVDVLISAVTGLKYTPTEIREAAMLAQIIVEENSPRLRFTLDSIDQLRRD